VVRVLFAAPFARTATLRFARALGELPGVRLALVTQEPLERVPEVLRERLAGHWRVADCRDPAQLVAAARGVVGQIGGPPERLLGILEHLQVPLAQAREALGLPGLSVEAAHNFRHKSRMKTVLRDAGLPCARYRLVHGEVEAKVFARETGFPLVVKPPEGAGAQGTHRLDDGAALDEALALFRPSVERPLLLEEFMAGEEYSFDSVLVRGRPVWHSVSRYLPAPLEVLRNPWIQWCVLLPREIDGPPWSDVVTPGFAAVRALGLTTGLSHLEWFRLRDGRIAISEVGARPPGAQLTSLLSWAHDHDFYRAWAHLMVFDEFHPPERHHAVGAAYLRGQGRGRVKAVHGVEEVQRELGHLVVEAELPRSGQAPTGTYEGEGYVIVRHPDTAVVEQALARIVRGLSVELG
jgi:hypothetical protein